MKKGKKKIKNCDVPPSIDKMKKIEPFGDGQWKTSPRPYEELPTEQSPKKREIEDVEAMMNVANIEISSMHVSKIWLSMDDDRGEIEVWLNKPSKKHGCFSTKREKDYVMQFQEYDSSNATQIFGIIPIAGECIGPLYVMIGI